MKKVNVYVNSVVRWAAYKKDDEYQSWIDYAVANNLWGQPGSYTVEVVDATAELEQKRLQSEATKKVDFDNHANNTENPHAVTKLQIGLGNVDDVSSSDLRDRSTHTGTQLSSTIIDFNEAAQDAVGNALTNSSNITFTYPDALNQISANLTDSGVVAGTYSLVTVDSKGRITSGSNSGSITRYTYTNNATVVNSNATYTTIPSLTTISLPVGLYRFRFFGIAQSGSTTNGIGIRIVNASSTISTILGKWFISQAANGTAQNFQHDQIALNTNITSTSVQAANTNFSIIGEGTFRITVAGTVAIQLRSELNGTSSSLLADSNLEVWLV